MSAFVQYGAMIHPDYRRTVDMYRPSAAQPRLQTEAGLQYERPSDIANWRHCRFSDSTATQTAQCPQNQQAFGASSRANNDRLCQRNLSKLQHLVYWITVVDIFLITYCSRWDLIGLVAATVRVVTPVGDSGVEIKPPHYEMGNC